jgi:uncharacterized Fe-S center protein
VRSIIDEIKELGGRPVIVECTTMCFGPYSSRATASDHLRTAARHGYTEETLGCPIWMCDGEYGFDDVKVDIPHGVILKHTYMGRKVLELDAMVVVSHFKGHPMGSFGGAIKNVGIGLGSKRGKITTHLLNHPVYGRRTWQINQQAAAALAEGPHPNGIDLLVKNCPFDALAWEDGVLKWDPGRCQQCLCCFGPGVFGGVFQPPPEITLMWAVAIADACAGYVNAIGSNRIGYVSYAMDVTPGCDCVNWHDRPLVPNIGVFASRDPVAIDMACLEAVEALQGIPGSKADDLGFGDAETERFTNCSSMAKISQWAQVNAAVFNGLGTSEYNLIVSEPGPELDFWPEPYTPENPWGFFNRKGLRKGNWTPDYPYTHETIQLSLPEIYMRPKGKVKEIAIAELGTNGSA